ncbi:hypothetical protein ADL27_30530, partial [Streptomyces sp. NRRL F-6602]
MWSGRTGPDLPAGVRRDVSGGEGGDGSGSARGGDGPDNEAALEASSAYLRARGWQDLPEPTD